MMLKRSGLAAIMLAFTLCGASAQQSPSYSGLWAVQGPDACKDGRNDDLKTRFSAKRFEYYANSCRVASSVRVSKSGDAAHRLKLACEGEGARSSREIIVIAFEVSGIDNDLLMHVDAATWETITYQRCGQ